METETKNREKNISQSTEIKEKKAKIPAEEIQNKLFELLSNPDYEI